MAITLTWTIDSMQCMIQSHGYTDVVYIVQWRLYANEDGYSTSIFESQQLSFDPTDPDYQFIPYDQLDEPTVISWLHGAMGMDMVAQYEATVTENLYKIMHPTIEIKPLPWAIPEQE